jgi:hypothetical protein
MRRMARMGFCHVEPQAGPVAGQLAKVEDLVGDYDMGAYLKPFSKPTSGTPIGRFWPRISWKVTTYPSAIRERSAVCPNSTR